MRFNIKIVACFMIFFGTILSIVGFASGGNSLIILDKSGFTVPADQELVKKSFALEPFSTINIDNDYGDIEIIESDNYALEFYSLKESDISYHVENDILTVQTNKSHKNRISIGFGSFDSPSIKIYIPKGKALSKIEMQNDFGDIYMENLTSETMDISNNQGDITLNNLDAGEAYITQSFGDISLQQFSSTMLSLNSKQGDIEIVGTLNGKTLITSNFGDVNMMLNNKKSELGLSLSTSFGDLTLDGKAHENELSQLNEDKNQLDVSVSQGDLDVTFIK